MLFRPTDRSVNSEKSPNNNERIDSLYACITYQYQYYYRRHE